MEIITTERPGGVSVLRPVGRLNMVTASSMREAIGSAVAAGRPKVVVDLAGVEFLDSSGLGALIAGLKTTRQAGGDLRIAAPNDQVSLVLRVTNLERILTAYSTAESAYDAG